MGTRCREAGRVGTAGAAAREWHVQYAGRVRRARERGAGAHGSGAPS